MCESAGSKVNNERVQILKILPCFPLDSSFLLRVNFAIMAAPNNPEGLRQDDPLAKLIGADMNSPVSPTDTVGLALSASDLQLNRMLSIHTELSTASSDTKHHAAAQAECRISFRKIGAGACGAVFAKDGESLAVKLAKDRSDSSELWNDFLMHKTIAESFATHKIDALKVPECYFFIVRDDKRFFDQHPSLVQAAEPVCHLPTDLLFTERILPLPQATRTLLIDKYCAPKNKQLAMADTANKDCLVRLYLGSTQGKASGMFFSLRNFKLHLNHMVEIQLDVAAIARRMAFGMAIMHWSAKTDARDVEFALGSSTKKQSMGQTAKELKALGAPVSTGPPSRIIEDFFHRTTELWLLDFNQVRPITLDEAGVAQAVQAASINDPYLPRPLQSDPVGKQVWDKFATSYLEQSRIIIEKKCLGDEVSGLPSLFLQGFTEAHRKKQEVVSAIQRQ